MNFGPPVAVFVLQGCLSFLLSGVCQHQWVLSMGEERLWCPLSVLEELNPRFCMLLEAEMLVQEFVACLALVCPSRALAAPQSWYACQPYFIPDVFVSPMLSLSLFFLAVLGKFPSCRDGNSCLSSSSSRRQSPWCILLAG